MGKEIEQARPKLGISISETCCPNGSVNRKIDFTINDLRLALIVIALIVLAVHMSIR